jgi:branched-chain amino acid aminotransferase
VNDAYVYINGAIVEASRATVSVSDRGFLFGDGLFETMRVDGGVIHMLGRHLRRLSEGATILEIDLPSDDELRGALKQTLEANGADQCIARLTVTRGEGGGPGATPLSPTIVVSLRPLLQERNRSNHTALVTLSTPHLPSVTPTRIKTLSSLGFVLAAREVTRRDADEGALLTTDGLVAEGSVSNIFIIEGGMLRTAPLSLGVLPGIARGRVLELARTLGLEVLEQPFTVERLRRADECFYTNAARGVVPVGSVDGVGLGGTRGHAERFREAYFAEIANEVL